MFFSTNDTDFISQAKGIIPVSESFGREKVWPYLEKAERKYIVPILGTELYNELSSFNNGSSSASGSGVDSQKSAELLRLIRIAELNLAMLLGFDVLSVYFSDSGFQRSESERYKGLYKYQEDNLKNHFSESGYDAIDDVLKYLEENIEYFPEWEDTETHIARKASFFKDADAYNQIVDIRRSRLTFLRLQPFIQLSLDMEIAKLLGALLWTKLAAEMQSESPDQKYIDIIPYVRKPLAYLSAALLVLNTGDLTDRGLYFEAKNSLFPDPDTARPADSDGLAMRYKHLRETGLSYLESLKQYLISQGITEYTGQSGSIFNYDNDNKKIFVS